MYEHEYMRTFGLEPVVETGPFKLYQRDRLVGTVPQYPVESTSGIFDVRPGDFKFATRDGERVLEASGMVGPGDIACIKGFVPADGTGDAYTNRDFADQFDALTKFGASRAHAIGTMLEDALSNPKGRK
jgi:hypothetical protein